MKFTAIIVLLSTLVAAIYGNPTLPLLSTKVITYPPAYSYGDYGNYGYGLGAYNLGYGLAGYGGYGGYGGLAGYAGLGYGLNSYAFGGYGLPYGYGYGGYGLGGAYGYLSKK